MKILVLTGRDRVILWVGTEPENFETARKAHVEPVSNMMDALDLAYRRCGADKPTITVMPQGANTFPEQTDSY